MPTREDVTLELRVDLAHDHLGGAGLLAMQRKQKTKEQKKTKNQNNKKKQSTSVSKTKKMR
jgi:hypothetical protein